MKNHQSIGPLFLRPGALQQFLSGICSYRIVISLGIFIENGFFKSNISNSLHVQCETLESCVFMSKLKRETEDM